LVLAAAGRINPIIAAVLHNLSTMLVIFNSARLIHYSPAASLKPDTTAAQMLKRTAAQRI
jgi:cation-transporting P-type ATPase C